MNASISFASDRRLQTVAAEAGYYELPPALQEGLKDLLVGAIEVMRKHLDDPERGDSRWRKQTNEVHMRHAQAHSMQALCASYGNETLVSFLRDDDGLEHWKHAAARFALACCVRRLVAETALKDGGPNGST